MLEEFLCIRSGPEIFGDNSYIVVLKKAVESICHYDVENSSPSQIHHLMHELKFLLNLHLRLKNQSKLKNNVYGVVDQVLMQNVCSCQLFQELSKESKGEEGGMAVFHLIALAEAIDVLSHFFR